MPYKSGETPGGTEKVPAHGKTIYRSAFNAAYEKYGEQRAHAIAWEAVKRKYKKRGSRWVARDGWDSVLRMLGEDFSPDQPRGKTSEGTNAGSFAPSKGGLSEAVMSVGAEAGVVELGAGTGGTSTPAGGEKASPGVPKSLVKAIEDHVGGMGGEFGQHGSADLTKWLMLSHREDMLKLIDDMPANKRPALLLHKGDEAKGMPSVWLLGWSQNEQTDIHDHVRSEVGISVLRGSVDNEWNHPPAGYLDAAKSSDGLRMPINRDTLPANTTVQLEAPYIHLMRGTSPSKEPGQRDISVHAYHPPLKQMHYFKSRGGALHYDGDWDEDRPPSEYSTRDRALRACPCCSSRMLDEWSEEAHPRGKTSEGSTPGSFAPGGGGGKGESEKGEPSKGAPSKGGKGEHPGKGYSKEASVDEKGVIHTTNIDDAARALYEGRKVELNQPREVATLLDKLGELSAAAIARGEKAPKLNLCDVSVKGTNLFCAESKDIPRIEMPQLAKDGEPGDAADFVKWLEGRGYGVEDGKEYASYLRATQNELKGAQVAGIAKFMQTEKGKALQDRPIVVSRDNYILDGHHSWAAKIGIDAANETLTSGKKMNIRRVDTDIITLLYAADAFTQGKGKKSGKDSAMIKDKEFSAQRRETLAKSGKAMKGGGFPIESESDLKNAIRAFGRAGNKAAAKAHIKKRASALGLTNLLPENWDAATATSFHDLWTATKDEKTCPTCDGSGEDPDDENEDCPTCDGTGVVDDDEDTSRRDRSTDSRQVQLTDKFTLDGGIRKTKDGYLVADARIARTGIQLYGGSEVGMPDMPVVRVYRPPEEVFSTESMRSLAHRPITLDHPPTMVNASNWKKYAVGQTGDEIKRDGEFVRVPMLIMDAKAIEAYEKHGIAELSNGYACELKWGAGTTPAGEAYDAKQTAIRGNHLAVVPAARGGSQLRIGDDQHTGGVDMVKVLIGGQTVEFTDELAAKHVQACIKDLQTQLAQANARVADAESEEEKESEQRVAAQKDAQSKDGEIVVLKKQLEDAIAKSSGAALDKAVKDRTELLLKAGAAMDGKVNFEGKSDAEVHRIVAAHHLGGEDAIKGMDAAHLEGAFRAITSKVKLSTGVDRLADSLSLLQHGGSSDQNNPRAVKEKAHQDYVNSLTTAWKTPRANAQ